MTFNDEPQDHSQDYRTAWLMDHCVSISHRLLSQVPDADGNTELSYWDAYLLFRGWGQTVINFCVNATPPITADPPKTV